MSAITIDDIDLSGTKYRLLRELGRGGMGAVYDAEDTELGRHVAIKIASTSVASRELVDRLRRESRVIARLEHPGIVPVHDAGTLPDGRVFYVMKLVRGERLDRWANTQTDLRARLRVFQRACEAVAFAHARGVIHRDLKPENVMVGEFGEALVMDWGLAKERGAAVPSTPDAPPTRPSLLPMDEVAATLPAGGAAGATVAGTIMGTPAYMSPEQARGESDALDTRSDVYGLGATLYPLLAGRPPFLEHKENILEHVIAGRFMPLREIDPHIPRPLEAICAKAMARSPDARYATAIALSDDIQHWLDADPVSAYREGPVELVMRFASRNRVVLSLLAAYLLLRVALIVFAR